MKQPDDMNTRPNNTTNKFHFNTHKLKVLTVNVNGLSNLNKRDKIFNLLKTKKVDLAVTRNSLYQYN